MLHPKSALPTHANATPPRKKLSLIASFLVQMGQEWFIRMYQSPLHETLYASNALTRNQKETAIYFDRFDRIKEGASQEEVERQYQIIFTGWIKDFLHHQKAAMQPISELREWCRFNPALLNDVRLEVSEGDQIFIQALEICAEKGWDHLNLDFNFNLTISQKELQVDFLDSYYLKFSSFLGQVKLQELSDSIIHQQDNFKQNACSRLKEEATQLHHLFAKNYRYQSRLISEWLVERLLTDYSTISRTNDRLDDAIQQLKQEYKQNKEWIRTKKGSYLKRKDKLSEVLTWWGKHRVIFAQFEKDNGFHEEDKIHCFFFETVIFNQELEKKLKEGIHNTEWIEWEFLLKEIIRGHTDLAALLQSEVSEVFNFLGSVEDVLKQGKKIASIQYKNRTLNPYNELVSYLKEYRETERLLKNLNKKIEHLQQEWDQLVSACLEIEPTPGHFKSVWEQDMIPCLELLETQAKFQPHCKKDFIKNLKKPENQAQFHGLWEERNELSNLTDSQQQASRWRAISLYFHAISNADYLLSLWKALDIKQYTQRQAEERKSASFLEIKDLIDDAFEKIRFPSLGQKEITWEQSLWARTHIWVIKQGLIESNKYKGTKRKQKLEDLNLDKQEIYALLDLYESSSRDRVQNHSVPSDSRAQNNNPSTFFSASKVIKPDKPKLSLFTPK